MLLGLILLLMVVLLFSRGFVGGSLEGVVGELIQCDLTSVSLVLYRKMMDKCTCDDACR
jgi:hypothetical protein